MHCILENLIQAFSTTFRYRFKDFQGPCLFSRTFEALKIWKKIQGLSRTRKSPGHSEGQREGQTAQDSQDGTAKMGVIRGASGISQLLVVAKLQSALGADNTRYETEQQDFLCLCH